MPTNLGDSTLLTEELKLLLKLDAIANFSFSSRAQDRKKIGGGRRAAAWPHRHPQYNNITMTNDDDDAYNIIIK